MGISALTWVSIIFQTLIGFATIRFGKYKIIRTAQPESLQDIIARFLLLGSAICTAAKKPFFPSSLPVAWVLIAVLVLGVAPPFLGLAENWFRRRGGPVFDKSRFPGHLVGNLLGASAAAGFLWAAHSVSGFVAFTQQFEDASAFNVVLPLTTVVIFSFLRQQQIARCPNLDDLVKRDADWQSKLRGFSLSDWNQLSNCLYLIVATFIGASTILYLFAFTLLRAKHGPPVVFSWQMALAVVALLGFLLACGTPWSWENRTVYFTFLTGTPGALIAVMIWLSLLQSSLGRNLFAIGVVGAGYLLYCGATVVGVVHGRRIASGGGEKSTATQDSAAPSAETLELHYFAAAILGFALIVMLGVLYLSQQTA